MENRVPVQVPYRELTCRFCGSKNLIKYGTYHGSQRVMCKDCGRKSGTNNALPYMQTPTDQVGAALGMYFEGQSLNSIGRIMPQVFNAYPADSTVYRWLERFVPSALDEAKASGKPNVGEEWIADETVLTINGKKIWCFDIIDSQTRYLLAYHLASTRTMRAARTLFEKASECAGKAPKRIITDGLNVYEDACELTFGSDSKHVKSTPFVETDSTNRIERWHGTLKDRLKTMRGLRDLKTARLVLDGWLLHYNYLRPHEALERTPAEAAGIRFPHKNWQDIVTKDQAVKTPQLTEVVVYTSGDSLQRGSTITGVRIGPKRARRHFSRRAQTQASLTRMRY